MNVIHDANIQLARVLPNYALPRADDLPPFRVLLEAQPESDNPLGVKGAGESATSGTPRLTDALDRLPELRCQLGDLVGLGDEGVLGPEVARPAGGSLGMT